MAKIFLGRRWGKKIAVHTVFYLIFLDFVVSFSSEKKINKKRFLFFKIFYLGNYNNVLGTSFTPAGFSPILIITNIIIIYSTVITLTVTR